MKQLLKPPKLTHDTKINEIDIRDYRKEDNKSPNQSQVSKNSIQLLLKNRINQEADEFLRTSKLFTKDTSQFTEDEIKDIMLRRFEREKLRKELKPDIQNQSPGQYLLDKYVHFVIGAESQLEEKYIEEQKRKEEEKKIQLSNQRTSENLDSKISQKRLSRVQTGNLNLLGRKLTQMTIDYSDSMSTREEVEECSESSNSSVAANEQPITMNDRKKSNFASKKNVITDPSNKINNMQLRKITPQIQYLKQQKSKGIEKINIKGNEQKKNQYGKQLKHQRYQQLSLQLDAQFKKVMTLSYVQRAGNIQATFFDLLFLRPFGEFQRLYIPEPFRQNLLLLQEISEGLLGCCENQELIQKRINQMFTQIIVQLQ